MSELSDYYFYANTHHHFIHPRCQHGHRVLVCPWARHCGLCGCHCANNYQLRLHLAKAHPQDDVVDQPSATALANIRNGSFAAPAYKAAYHASTTRSSLLSPGFSVPAAASKQPASSPTNAPPLQSPHVAIHQLFGTTVNSTVIPVRFIYLYTVVFFF